MFKKNNLRILLAITITGLIIAVILLLLFFKGSLDSTQEKTWVVYMTYDNFKKEYVVSKLQLLNRETDSQEILQSSVKAEMIASDGKVLHVTFVKPVKKMVAPGIVLNANTNGSNNLEDNVFSIPFHPDGEEIVIYENGESIIKIPLPKNPKENQSISSEDSAVVLNCSESGYITVYPEESPCTPIASTTIPGASLPVFSPERSSGGYFLSAESVCINGKAQIKYTYEAPKEVEIVTIYWENDRGLSWEDRSPLVQGNGEYTTSGNFYNNVSGVCSGNINKKTAFLKDGRGFLEKGKMYAGWFGLTSQWEEGKYCPGWFSADDRRVTVKTINEKNCSGLESTESPGKDTTEMELVCTPDKSCSSNSNAIQICTLTCAYQ